MRCHIQGQGFGIKMYISDLFTVVGYLHTAVLKTAEELILPSVHCLILIVGSKSIFM